MARQVSNLGTGTNLFPAGRITGAARWFLTPADVVSAREDELPGIVAFVHQGGMTFLSPVIGEVQAVVCTAGSLESHLAILAREFEVPCVMAAHLTGEVNDGDEVLLDLTDPLTARITVMAARRPLSPA